MNEITFEWDLTISKDVFSSVKWELFEAICMFYMNERKWNTGRKWDVSLKLISSRLMFVLNHSWHCCCGKSKLNIVSDIICVNEVHWMSHCLYLTTIHCMRPIESDSIMNPATLMTLQFLYVWQRYRRVRKVRFISFMWPFVRSRK